MLLSWPSLLRAYPWIGIYKMPLKSYGFELFQNMTVIFLRGPQHD